MSANQLPESEQRVLLDKIETLIQDMQQPIVEKDDVPRRDNLLKRALELLMQAHDALSD